MPHDPSKMYTNPWHLRPTEIADLLQLAASMLESPDESTRIDRNTIARQLRRTMRQINPIVDPAAVAAEYYLSPTACSGILRRAAKRGKELPRMLWQALTYGVDD